MDTPISQVSPRQSKRIAVFDFDGTLVDVTSVFIEIFNTLANTYGYEPISPEELPRLRNMSARELIRSRMRIPFWRLWIFAYRARSAYRKRINTIQLFPGIKSILEDLRTNGYRVGIVSSNSEKTISSLMEQFGIPTDFIYTSHLFGKSRTLNTMLSKEHLTLQEVIYIGDEVRDVEACQKSGIDIIAVTWGLNSEEALRKAGATTIDQPAKLLETLLTYRYIKKR